MSQLNKNASGKGENMKNLNQKSSGLMANTFFAIICFVILFFIARDYFSTKPTYYSPQAPQKIITASGLSKEEMKKLCELHISNANKDANQIFNARIATFVNFVKDRKSGSKMFASDIVSLSGKWQVVKGYLPFTEKEGHKKYVANKFSQHIFTNDELSNAMKLAINGSLKDLEGIENDLAVKMRQVILGRSLAPNEAPIAAENFKLAIEQMVCAAKHDTLKSTGSLVASEAASSIATPILIRMGISAGILGAGAANSGWTFGSSIVVGLLVDFAWEWIDDPAGDIEIEMNSALDKLALDASYAMKTELQELLSKRSTYWNITLAKELK